MSLRLQSILVDREEELKVLGSALSSGRSELILVYGRRRIGKTYLMNYLLNKYGGVYFIINYEDPTLMLRDLSKQFTNISGVKTVFETPRDFLDAIYRIDIGNIIVIDEFQRSVSSGLPALLQEYWDRVFSKNNYKIVLLGSSIGIMVRIGLSYQSPLYGRFTHILKLQPFSYRIARVFFRDWSEDDRVRGYSVFGGTPAYLAMIDPNRDLWDNIYELILSPGAPLKEEPLYLLQMETREPWRYLGILEAIAHGARRIGEISSRTGLGKEIISKYLRVLEHHLGFVKREYPVLMEGKPGKAYYRISDLYMSFWLRNIWGNPLITRYSTDHRILKVIEKNLEQYTIPYVWEHVCRETLEQMLIDKGILLHWSGRWWYKDIEIDYVGIDEENNTVYFMECKWSKKPVNRKTLKNLISKSKKFPWRRDRRREVYIICSPKGYTGRRNHIRIIDLEVVRDVMNKHKSNIYKF